MKNVLKKHPDIQQIKSGLTSFFTFLCLILILIFASPGCKHEHGKLDSVFIQLEKNSPDSILKQFKMSNLDSTIISNAKYNAIFVETMKTVIRNDSTIIPNIKTVFKSYGIPPVGKQIELTFMAAFHKYLKGK